MKNIKFIIIFLIALLFSSIACSIEKIDNANSTKNPKITATNFPKFTGTVTQIPTNVSTITPEIKFAVTNVEVGLNIRENPNEFSKIIFTIPPNSKIEILNNKSFDGWYLICYKSNNIDYIGYVNGKWIIIE